MTKAAADKRAELSKLDGAAFDKAYLANVVAYHKTVNGALETTLIPSATNPALSSLLKKRALKSTRGISSMQNRLLLN